MRFDLFLLAFLCFSTVASSEASPTPLKMPNPAIRKEMVFKAVAEMSRLDGEGLIPRFNRPISWDEATLKLSEEAEKAEDLFALGRVFRRLDATYPNLHAKVYLALDLDERKSRGDVVLPITFSPAFLRKGAHADHFVVSDLKVNISGLETRLRKGDQLIQINGLPVEKWADENFIFCKFPLREQCDLELYDNFRHELLGWNRHQPLNLTVVHDGKEVSIDIPFEVKSQDQQAETDSVPCGVSAKRYPGFDLKYHGYNLCAFESKRIPSTVLFRIRSFVYEESSPFMNLPGEVEVFWNNYWRHKSKTTKNLVIDIVSNYGGEAPIPYYALLFPSAFQEQYVQFKKLAEFERREILESLFWGDGGKEIWFENIKKNGTFAATREGDFLAPIPQFCANGKKDCREDLFEPKKNAFRGSVKILVNHWCVSSCVGFISNVVDVLGKRVATFGLPDSGDSAYARLTLAISPITNGVDTKITALKKARKPDEPEPWIRQVVAVTRSTNHDAKVISGQPQKIDVWVPKKWDQTEDEWVAEVLKTALWKNRSH